MRGLVEDECVSTGAKENEYLALQLEGGPAMSPGEGPGSPLVLCVALPWLVLLPLTMVLLENPSPWTVASCG